MIELILGILVLIGTLGWAFLIFMAAAMTDGPPPADLVGQLWLTLGIGTMIDVGLFLLWFAKTKGWN